MQVNQYPTEKEILRTYILENKRLKKENDQLKLQIEKLKCCKDCNNVACFPEWGKIICLKDNKWHNDFYKCDKWELD
jgi:hypothetical protein